MKITSSMPFVVVDGAVYAASEIEEMAFEGKTIYEVIRVIGGRPLFMAEHLERLVNSGKTLEMPVSGLSNEVAQGIRLVIEHSGIVDNNIKILAGMLSSGVFCWTVFPVKSFYPTPHYYQKGVKTVLMHIERKNPNAKVLNAALSEKIELLRETTDIFEGLLVDGNNHITEGSRSNVFFVDKNRILTPASSEVLIGITREKILGIAKDLDISFEECQIEATQAYLYDACFITGTSIGVLPVSSIDNHSISSPENVLLRKLQEGYEKIVRMSLNEIDWEVSS